MKHHSFCALALGLALGGLLAFLPISSALAQECGGKIEGETEVTAPERTLVLLGSGYVGHNYIEIPAFSGVNENPNSYSSNGFVKLCEIFGLTGSGSQILQIDPENGVIHTFYCDQALAPDFLPCHGVRILPYGVEEPITGTIPMVEDSKEGIEGSWYYPVWSDDPNSAMGDHILGIPLTISDTSPEKLCSDLHLTEASWASITYVEPEAGDVYTHTCGDEPEWELVPGSAVIVRSSDDSEGLIPIY